MKTEPLSLEEQEKCSASPYYFATKYLTMNGKPFTTRLSEEEFNKWFEESNTKLLLKRRRIYGDT